MSKGVIIIIILVAAVLAVLGPLATPLVPAPIAATLAAFGGSYFFAGGLIVGAILVGVVSRSESGEEKPVKKIRLKQEQEDDPTLESLARHFNPEKKEAPSPVEVKPVEFDINKETQLALIRIANILENGVVKPTVPPVPLPPTYEELLKEHNDRLGAQ